MTTATPTEYEQLVFGELIEHYAARRPHDPVLPANRYDLGRYDGYAAGLAAAIHHLSGEPIGDIQEQAHDAAVDLRIARHERSLS